MNDIADDLFNPKISIILPTYNGAEFIKESIESVLMQDEHDFELIIVNDCSNDNTAEIIKEYAQKDSRIKLITNEENMKLPESLNIGFRMATGKYFTWTSDDNFYKQGALKYMAEYLDKNPNISLIACEMDGIEEDGRIKYPAGETKKYAIDLMHANNVLACFMYTKEIAKKVGEYDNELFCAEDYDYWCRIAIEGEIAYSNENLYSYRFHKNSLTATKETTTVEKANIIRGKYIEKLHCKYTELNTKKELSDFYYNKWKGDKDFKKMKIAITASPVRALGKILCYTLRQIFTIKKRIQN